MVDTSDEWITTRTGIKERRIAAKDEYTSDMAAKAALAAMEQAGDQGGRNRSDSRRHRHARHGVPSDGLFRADEDRREQTRPVSISPRPAPDFFSRSKSRSNSSPRTPTTPCSSSARRNSPRSPIGPIAIPVCFSATARARPSCGIAAAAPRRHQHSHRQRRAVCRHPLHARRRLPHSDHARKCRPATCKRSTCRARKFTNRPSSRCCDASKKALEQAGLTIDDIACVIPHQANAAHHRSDRRSAEDSARTIFRESRSLRQHFGRRGRHRAR